MIRTASYSDIGGRARNEDSYCQARSRGNRFCAVLADGLGGHGNGEIASDTACRTVCTAWNGEVSASVLTKLVTEAQKQVLALQNRFCSMKSTIVVLLTDEQKAAWAHVGDSRLYYFYNGALRFQTKDHSAAQLAVALGDITEDQIRGDKSRNTLFRALGQDNELKVESKEITLEQGKHAFLLCSDGFWEFVLENEMELDLKNAKDPEDWLQKMKDRMQQRIPEKNDNNTAAAIWID